MKRLLLAMLLVLPCVFGCSGSSEEQQTTVQAPPSDTPTAAAAGTAEDRGSPETAAPPTK